MNGPVLRLLCGHVLDVLRSLPEASVHCVVTSPPYLWLRDYGTEPQVWPDGWRGSLGLEPTVELYVEHVVQVFRQVWRVLRDDGSLWLNVGDCYAPSSTSNHGRGKARPASNGRGESQKPNGWENPPRVKAPGLKPKDLVGVPWRVALALQADGWYLRRDIVWSKVNPMPESVTDRPSTAHEYVFLLTKRPSYFYDADAVRERAAYLAPNAPDKIKSPHGQGFTQRASGAAATFKRENSKRVAAQVGQRHGTHRPDREAVEYNGPERNLRSVWSLASSPFPEAHFATFPVEIPTTAIKAGTSKRGCCPSCGAPWKRVVAKEFKPQGDVSIARGLKGAPGQKPMDMSNGWDGFPRGSTLSTTTGWRQTCACPPAEPIPCTVLDPFNGAGTSGLAAARLGRSYMGIDLNPEYCEMARRRIEGDAPLLNAVAEEPDPQAPLFGENPQGAGVE